MNITTGEKHHQKQCYESNTIQYRDTRQGPSTRNKINNIKAHNFKIARAHLNVYPLLHPYITN